MLKLNILLCSAVIFFTGVLKAQEKKRMLVFSKVTRYHHSSIPAAFGALQKLGAEMSMAVDTTSDAGYFTEDSLKNYAVVVFSNTSGDHLLDTVQKAEMERYIQAGGGFVGIHGAAATEYQWQWYGRLLGAWFESHPEPQNGTVKVADRKHPSVKHLPRKWKRFDEWYNYRNLSEDLNVLLTLDEKSYKGGKQGADHPVAWYHAFDGGRSFYTGLGHTKEAYSDPLFLQHLKEGIKYAAGGGPLDYSKARSKKIIKPSPRVLVFSKTRGWKHSSIPQGIAAILQLARENHFRADTTTDAAYFNDDSLKNYHAVIFNNTTGNVLNADQQSAFERYIQAGGGFAGLHAAADTEHDWPWYGNLVGAHFHSHPNHPNVRKAVVEVTDKNHLSSSMLPARWERTDEWYNYKFFYAGIKVIASLDENSYEGGTHGADHPIAWYHQYDGGRAFYTGGGHTEESYTEPLFLQHLLGGIRYAIGNGGPLDYSKAYSRTAPDQNRFVKKILAGNMDSPMELAVADDGRVFYTELSGKLSVYDPRTGKPKLIHKFPTPKERGTGLIGVALDPSFSSNNFIYLYYAPAHLHEDSLYFKLSRFVLTKSNELDLASEKVILVVPFQINGGSHHGGSIAWDKEGNLYLSTGDDTSPFPSNGYAPLDERPGKYHFSLDAQRSAANTNDLKGKILRIKPQPDGSYTIPEGNLFPPGTPKTRPEIYVMGARNPYRIAVNPKTSVLYWGDIGPDAGKDSLRGPRGYDEFNQAKKPGNYGWPYFVGDNYAYPDWDFETNTAGPLFDPLYPVNKSVNNTGLDTLPPAMKPMIWYPYAMSERFPELGLGGRCAIAGDFYIYKSNGGSPDKFPEYYDGALFIADWMRNWVKSVEFDSAENYRRTQDFMKNGGDFRRPIDIAFGKDGLMYMLEYGSVYGAANDDARLVQISYQRGNRPPVAKASIVDTAVIDSIAQIAFLTSDFQKIPQLKTVAGQPPLTIKLSGLGSKDFDDEDELSYKWIINGRDTLNGMNAEFTFTKPGVSKAVLLVTDRSGFFNTDTVTVKVGNTKPDVVINSPDNKSFGKDKQQFRYSITVKDREDGRKGYNDVKAYYLYNPLPGREALNFKEINYPGKTYMAASDCKSCHLPDKKAVGPSYVAIANRYKKQNGAVQKLAAKIISGGGGSWGTEYVMSAHPQLSTRQAEEMVKYIFSLTDEKPKQKVIPLKGSITLSFNEKEPRGTHNIIAVYTDKGGKATGPLSDTDLVSIRNAAVKTLHVDEISGFPRFNEAINAGNHKSYVMMSNVDMNNINSFTFLYSSRNHNGEIEVRRDSRAGPVIARVPFSFTGSWKKTATVTANLDTPLRGRHDLYFFVLKKEKPNESIIELKEIRFGN